MEWEFSGEVVQWRGPAPYLFVPFPDELRAEFRDVARLATYGWGVVPATVRIGATTFTTSIFPKDGGYLVPVKVVVQRAEGVELGDIVDVRVEVQLR